MAVNDYTLILKHLEKLEIKIDGLSTDLQQTNIEMAKLSGMKHTLADLKNWKENVESVVNPNDLREMKKALAEIKALSENIDKTEEDLKILKEEKEEDQTQIVELKTFNTKITTIGAIVSFLFTIAMVVIGWAIS